MSKKSGRPVWFEEGLKFTCQPGCVRCCTGPPGDVLCTSEEIAAMAALLGISPGEFEDSYIVHYSSGNMSLRERPNGDCVMLKGAGCGVYSCRPKQCRTYPFWPEVTKNPFSWLKEADRCPGINVGEVHDVIKITALLKSQED